MQRLLLAARYLVSFGLARSALFFAPILLGNLLAPADYGRLEFAHAVASLGATVLALGTSAAIPLVLLRNIKTASWGGILTHQAGAVTVLCMVAAVAAISGAPHLLSLSALCISVLLLQGLWSVTLKSRGQVNESLMLDAGFWGGMALAVSLAYGLAIPESERWMWAFGALTVYLFALGCWTVRQLVAIMPGNTFRMYAATVHTGVPLMAATLLASLAVTSGRLGIGILSTPEVTADYAILFRATALPIVVHQIILVAGFRQVFELPERQLERRLSWIVMLVVMAVAAFWALSGIFGPLLGGAFVSTFARHRPEGLLILTQCILWSAIALNDLANTRALIMGTVVRWSALYFMLSLPLAWFYLSGRPVNLLLFVSMHSVVMAGYLSIQVLMMWHCGVRLFRIWVLTFVSFMVLSAAAFWS